jgi:hypothetical protein
MTVLEKFREDVAPIDPVALARGRARLLAEASGGPPPTVHNRRPLWTRGRLVAAAATAVVLALIVAGSQLVHSGASNQPNLTATEVLQRAALVAMRMPPTSARPDQFVYLESLNKYYLIMPKSTSGTEIVSPLATQGPNGAQIKEEPEVHQQLWLSADGRRDGLLRQTPIQGGKLDLPGDTIESGCPGDRPAAYHCTPLPAYRADLPTTTDAMLAFLYSKSTPDGPPPDNQAFSNAYNLMESSLIQPAAMSTLFSALARIPGVTVTQDMVDAAGRHGIAVGFTYAGNDLDAGTRQELIFDPQTFNYLGAREVAVLTWLGQAPGTVLGYDAVLTVAVVDKVGQLP